MANPIKAYTNKIKRLRKPFDKFLMIATPILGLIAVVCIVVSMIL